MTNAETTRIEMLAGSALSGATRPIIELDGGTWLPPPLNYGSALLAPRRGPERPSRPPVVWRQRRPA